MGQVESAIPARLVEFIFTFQFIGIKVNVQNDNRYLTFYHHPIKWPLQDASQKSQINKIKLMFFPALTLTSRRFSHEYHLNFVAIGTGII